MELSTARNRRNKTMANEKTHEIQKTDSGTQVAVEQTKSGPVYVPAVDIFEDDTAITLVADMPGVGPNDLRIDLHEGVLTLTGQANEGERGGTDVFREYRPGQFCRQFSLSDRIDQNKIEAGMTDGVLRLVLPKAEAQKPRQIKVKTK
jgi:HSP20 family protein